VEQVNVAVFGYTIIRPTERNLTPKNTTRFQYAMNLPNGALGVNQVLKDVVHVNLINRSICPRPVKRRKVNPHINWVQSEIINIHVSRFVIWATSKVQFNHILCITFWLTDREERTIHLSARPPGCKNSNS